MAFGYSPDKAERIKNRLDSELGKFEARIRRLAEVVPHSDGLVLKADALLEGVREYVAELQDLVDERTDRERVA